MTAPVHHKHTFFFISTVLLHICLALLCECFYLFIFFLSVKKDTLWSLYTLCIFLWNKIGLQPLQEVNWAKLCDWKRKSRTNIRHIWDTVGFAIYMQLHLSLPRLFKGTPREQRCVVHHDLNCLIMPDGLVCVSLNMQ